MGAIFRNEATHLAEWVAFHLLQGVERFWLYNNRSVDDWAAELEPFTDDGTVRVIDWPAHPGQHSAYADCIKRCRPDTAWLALIDIDEYLFSPTGQSLPTVLTRFRGAAAVVANWRTFGIGGWHERPPGLTIESYLMRAHDDDPINRHVKSIVRPRRTSTLVENPHHFRHYGLAVGENGDPVTSAFRSPSTCELLRINHYHSRSVRELKRKQARPHASDGRLGRREPAPDDLRDETALSLVPAVKATLAARYR